jgi:propionyl-CoA carboxylase beta chain
MPAQIISTTTALDMLSTKREKNPPKKHGNIPL